MGRGGAGRGEQVMLGLVGQAGGKSAMWGWGGGAGWAVLARNLAPRQSSTHSHLSCPATKNSSLHS